MIGTFSDDEDESEQKQDQTMKAELNFNPRRNHKGITLIIIPNPAPQRIFTQLELLIGLLLRRGVRLGQPVVQQDRMRPADVLGHSTGVLGLGFTFQVVFRV